MSKLVEMLKDVYPFGCKGDLVTLAEEEFAKLKTVAKNAEEDVYRMFNPATADDSKATAESSKAATDKAATDHKLAEEKAAAEKAVADKAAADKAATDKKAAEDSAASTKSGK